MSYADSLRSKLDNAKGGGSLFPSRAELATISAYGFCLPNNTMLSQNEAFDLAVAITKETYGLPDAWQEQAEIYYSFFYQENQRYVWRVIF